MEARPHHRATEGADQMITMDWHSTTVYLLVLHVVLSYRLLVSYLIPIKFNMHVPRLVCVSLALHVSSVTEYATSTTLSGKLVSLHGFARVPLSSDQRQTLITACRATSGLRCRGPPRAAAAGADAQAHTYT